MPASISAPASVFVNADGDEVGRCDGGAMHVLTNTFVCESGRSGIGQQYRLAQCAGRSFPVAGSVAGARSRPRIKRRASARNIASSSSSAARKAGDRRRGFA